MNVENRIKHDLEMMVRYFNKFMDDIEEYELENADNEIKLDHLQELLTRGNPFNTNLWDVLYNLYDYEQDIKDNL